jgi:hypothetical protein
MLFVLAITPPNQWRSKEDIYVGLGEFRIPVDGVLGENEAQK